TILGDCQATDYTDRKVDLHWRSIGRITLPSGRLIASDGAMAGRGAMLARRLSAGEHEVRIAVMAWHERIAFALLEVSGRACNEIVRWEPALFENGPPDLEEPG